MKVISAEKKLCLSCMEEHQVKRVEVQEENIFKGLTVKYPARYEYCNRTDEFLTYEDSLITNDLAFKDAYREKVGLLTSREIVGIREMYGVSQKDFCAILGWGSSTINRYENHQVQSVAHNDILSKLADDPKWFLELLNRAKDILSEKAYLKYLGNTKECCRLKQDEYARAHIETVHMKFNSDPILTGNTDLNLDKVVEVIGYLARNITNLFLVKLLKMLWYSDSLHFKRYGRSISGLVYVALPMGAVPDAYKSLLLLKGIEYDEMQCNESISFRFKTPADFEIRFLSDTETQVLDEVIKRFKYHSGQDMIVAMHQEEAYKNTLENQPISYKHAKNLSI